MSAKEWTYLRRNWPQGLSVAIGDRSYRACLLHAGIAVTRSSRRRLSVGRVAHRHPDVFHIILYTGGNTEAAIGGIRRSIQPGTVVLSSPGDVHDFGPILPGHVVYSEVTFTFADTEGQSFRGSLSEILAAYGGASIHWTDSARILELPLAPMAEMTGLFEILAHGAKQSDSLCALEAQQTLGRFFTFLIRMLDPSLMTQMESDAKARLAAARSHIESHYHEPIAAAALAKRACMSPGYFFRAFKRAYGCSPVAYQNRLRAEAAGVLLYTSNLSCERIAERLGYCDAQHFSKAFRKHMKQSPSRYRSVRQQKSVID